MRQQICTRAIIIGIFANSILERLADTQNAVSFDDCKAKLMVPSRIATPKIRNPILQGFTQVPIVHTPNDYAARREPRIKATNIQNNPLCLIAILVTLALDTNGVFKDLFQTIDRIRFYVSFRTIIGVAESHVHLAVFAPATLTVFYQQVFTRAQRDLHNFSSRTSSSRSNFDSHRLSRHRTNLFHLRPPHVGTLPGCRHRGQEAIARIVTSKIHHVKITQTASPPHYIVCIREAKFARNLVDDNSVDTPVKAILRRRFTRHHDRTERIHFPVRNIKSRRHRISRLVHAKDSLCKRRLCRIRQQVFPRSPIDVDIHKVTRSIRIAGSHAATIDQSACARMNYHVDTFYVRVCRKRNAERSRFRRILGSRRNGIVNKLQIVTTASLVKFSRLFTLHLASAVIADNLLIQLIGT